MIVIRLWIILRQVEDPRFLTPWGGLFILQEWDDGMYTGLLVGSNDECRELSVTQEEFNNFTMLS